MKKKEYKKPVINRISLDNIISLQMASAPVNPPPRGGGSKGTSDPFQSPFDNKPFG